MYNSKYAKDYLNTRGLDITKLEVGYITGQMHHGTRRDEALINNCVSVGLLLPWSTSKTGEQGFRSFARECIAFAMRDKQGNITGLYFRSTDSHPAEGLGVGTKLIAKHFYLKESTGLYPHYPNQNAVKLILTESIIDAATLLQLSIITAF